MGDNPQGMSDSGRQNGWQVLAPKICTSCQNLNNCILCGDQLWGILKKVAVESIIFIRFLH